MGESLDPTVLGGLFALGAVVGVSLLMKYMQEEEKPTPKAPAVAAPKAASSSSKKKNKKDKKDKKKAAKAEVKKAPTPEPESSSSEEEEPEVVEKKKKKKKKSKKKEPEPELTKKQKKKAKKAKEAVAAAAPAPAPAPVAAAPSKKSKKKDKAPVDDEPWEDVPVSKKKSSKKVKVIVTTEEGGATGASCRIDLGSNVRAVIGQKGAVIQGMQQATGASIKIQKESSFCDVSGTPEAVADAERMIREILNNHKSATINVGANVGAIVGRGGSNIKAIQAQSGAQVNLQKDSAECIVTGTTDQIAAATALIKEYQEFGGPKPVAKSSFDVGDGKFIILGHKGETIRRLQEETGARLTLEDTMLHMSGPTYDVVVKATQAVTKLLEDNSNKETVSLGTDRSVFGAVVGKGGAMIQQIQQTSKARININREGGGEASLQLSGTKEAIAKAKQLIQQAIAEENGPPKPAKGEVIESVELGTSAGSIIGKGGSNISRLQEETGARLVIKNGFCYILGKKDSVVKAKAEVDAAVEKDRQFAESRAKAAAPPTSEWNPEENVEGAEAPATSQQWAASPDDASWTANGTAEEWGGGNAEGW